MPSIAEGLTTADPNIPGARAPEVEMTPEQVAATEQIRAQSATARSTPSDDFNADDIRAALYAPDPTTVQAGLVTAPEAEARELEEAYERWEQSDEGQRSRARRDQDAEDLQLGRTARRMAEVVGPAFEVLRSTLDPEERAAAVVTLNPTERGLAINEGLMDEEELEDLVRIGADILDRRQVMAGQMHAAIAEQEHVEGRLSEWEEIRREYGLMDERDAQDVLLYAAQQVDADTAGRASLSTLPPGPWGVAVRSVLATMQDAMRGHAERDWKQAILDEDLGDIASGLTEGGVPARPRVVLQPRFHPAKAIEKALQRGRVETREQIKHGIMTATDDTSVEQNIHTGPNVPEETQQKALKLLGSRI